MHATAIDVRGKKTSYSDANLRAVMIRVPTKGTSNADIPVFPVDNLGKLSEWQAYFEQQGEPGFEGKPGAELEDDLFSHQQLLQQRVLEPLTGPELDRSVMRGRQFSDQTNRVIDELAIPSTKESDLYKYTSVLNYPVRNVFDGDQSAPMSTFAIEFAYSDVYTRAQMMYDSIAAEKNRLSILHKNIEERIEMLDYAVEESGKELELLTKQRDEMLEGLQQARHLKEKKEGIEEQMDEIKRDGHFAAFWVNRQRLERQRRLSQGGAQARPRSPTPTLIGYVTSPSSP
jgi:hypothetical protein